MAVKFAQTGLYQVYLIVYFDLIDDKYKYIFDCKNLTVVVLNKRKTIDFKFMRKLKSLMKDLNPDIISSHLTCIAYLKFIVNFKEKRVFHTIHNLPKKDLPFIYRLLIRKDVKKGRIKLIGISNEITRLAASVYHINVDKIIPIYNGVSLKKVTYTNKYYDFLCVGRFVYWKHFPNLIKAFSMLNPTENNYRLCICGYGPDKINILNTINELNLSSCIDVFDEKTNTEELYKKSKFFCLFSSVEGNPIVILEAMSYGLPVVSTYTGGIPDVVQNGETGFLFNYEDVVTGSQLMRRLIESNNLLNTLKANSLKRINQFSIETTFESYKKVFDTNIL